jgi:adenine-specific DNA-methyltransferase
MKRQSHTSLPRPTTDNYQTEPAAPDITWVSESIAPWLSSTHAEANLGDALQRKQALGQFMTPGWVAEFMASLFTARWKSVSLLDAGAGAGALTAAVIRRLCSARVRPERVSVTAYELDSALMDALRNTMNDCRHSCERAAMNFSATVLNQDFIAEAAPMVLGSLGTHDFAQFDAAIVNPPYHKIHGDSATRMQLRSALVETSNLYTAFLALIVGLLKPGGELVAITPRSFCNGPYFRSFRTDFLARMSLRRIHVFASRRAAFGAEDVLQENVILHAIRERPVSDRVTVSSSSGTPDGTINERVVPYEEVIPPGHPQKFIHIPIDPEQSQSATQVGALPLWLNQLGIGVSTGRVVDFRVREQLRQLPEAGTAPLIYPCHFNGVSVIWPKPDCRKPNAIVIGPGTRDLLVPSGNYVLVKRFTAKEERRRIVACIYDPARITAPLVGFENHVNYFHANGRGLDPMLARGLAAFLNSRQVDAYFRRFSGHTQVNATDLRTMKYPARAFLEQLGLAADDKTQDELDRIITQEVT